MIPRQFLLVAEDMIEGDAEGHWRSAISRAYYAAFHVGRELMARCGFRVPESERAHKHVNDRLMNAGHEGVKEAGTSLDILRRRRNDADYHLTTPLSRLKADQQVETARSIIEALEAAEADPVALFAITQAMRDYERGRGDVTWKG
jgi:uncharacterized protein (UPF0332 family)